MAGAANMGEAAGGAAHAPGVSAMGAATFATLCTMARRVSPKCCRALSLEASLFAVPDSSLAVDRIHELAAEGGALCTSSIAPIG